MNLYYISFILHKQHIRLYFLFATNSWHFVQGSFVFKTWNVVPWTTSLFRTGFCPMDYDHPTPNILYLDIFSMYISEQIVNQQAFDQCSFGIRGVHRFCGLWWTQVMDSWPWIPQTSQNLRSLKFIVGHSEFRIPKSHLKYGGRNPAPVDRWLIPLFIGFQHVWTIQNWWCRISLVHPQ